MRRWPAQFLLLALIWGSSFLLIKVALEALAPLHVAFGRMVLGAAALLVVLLVRRAALPRDRRLWGLLAGAALLNNVAPYTLFAYGEQYVSSVLAGIFNATTPLLTLAVAMATLPEERPTRQRLVGLLVGFAGVLVVLGFWRGLGGTSLLGSAACLGAAACYGLGGPYTRRYLSGRAESDLSLSTAQLLLASLLLVLVLPVAGPVPTQLPARVVLSMLGLGVLGTGLAYLVFYSMIRVAGATTTSTITYVIPLVSTALGVAVLGESLSWNQPVGALVVLAGVALSQGMLRFLTRPGRVAAGPSRESVETR